ncbi:MAG: TetR/AcrR family transcriptional regulator [Aquincola sp.]|nr:TetR/AcrR family transcriptional regulator [Aquincola sp.]|tara:strand:- start:147 stop:878 length:732 start_codon:yes stop_codon:yes gene_type:complete
MAKGEEGVAAATKARPSRTPAVKPSAAAKKTVAKKAPPAAGAAVPAQRKRRNRRSEETISNILAVTEQIVLESGAERISILDVCKAASISRGTFYRYFSSQDELLDAFSRHKRETFHRNLVDAMSPHDDPDQRFEALIGYLDQYLEHGRARRLLLVAPDYALNFFKRIFHDAIVRFEDVLAPVFTVWDERLGFKVDRDLVCEMLIRYVMSELLVPGTSDRRHLPRRVARLVAGIAGQNRPARR